MIEVQPAAEMLAHPEAQHVPVYTVTDTKRGRVFTFDDVLFHDDRPPCDKTVVALYKSSTSDRVLLVKTIADPASSEIGMVDHLNFALDHDVLREIMCSARVLWRPRLRRRKHAEDDAPKPRNFYAVALSHAGNTLHSRMRFMTRPARLAVLLRVCGACTTLMTRAHVVYLDMKPSNVCLVDDDPATTRLIDYGSLSLIDTTEGVATYPPPEYPFGVDVAANETVQAYALAVLVVVVLNPTRDTEYPLRFRNINDTPVERAAEQLEGAIAQTIVNFNQQRCCRLLQDAVVSCLRRQGSVEALQAALEYEVKTCTS